MATMTEVNHNMRFPRETMTNAIHRLATTDETMTEVLHRGAITAAPSEVKTLTASSITGTGFTLSWDAITDAQDILVYVHQIGKPSYVSVSIILAGNATGATITGLLPSTDYTATVVASGVGGSSSDTILVSTTI